MRSQPCIIPKVLLDSAPDLIRRDPWHCQPGSDRRFHSSWQWPDPSLVWQVLALSNCMADHAPRLASEAGAQLQAPLAHSWLIKLVCMPMECCLLACCLLVVHPMQFSAPT